MRSQSTFLSFHADVVAVDSCFQITDMTAPKSMQVRYWSFDEEDADQVVTMEKRDIIPADLIFPRVKQRLSKSQQIHMFLINEETKKKIIDMDIKKK